MQKIEHRCSLRNALSPLEQIVQSEAKIRMVRNFWDVQIL